MIVLTRAQLKQVVDAAEAAWPAECCGLLIGAERPDGTTEVARVAPSPNRARGRDGRPARDRFEVDPGLAAGATAPLARRAAPLGRALPLASGPAGAAVAARSRRRLGAGSVVADYRRRRRPGGSDHRPPAEPRRQPIHRDCRAYRRLGPGPDPAATRRRRRLNRPGRARPHQVKARKQARIPVPIWPASCHCVRSRSAGAGAPASSLGRACRGRGLPGPCRGR